MSSSSWTCARGRPLAARRRCGSRSGSAMMSPTVMRGFSEAYGSWKIIWISRRHGLSARPRQLGDVLTLVDDRAAGRLLERASAAWPAVDLPQPDSPTRPRRLAAVQVEGDAVDGLDARRSFCLKTMPWVSGKCFFRSRDLEQRLTALAEPREATSVTPRCSTLQSDTRGPAVAVVARSLTVRERWQAEPRPTSRPAQSATGRTGLGARPWPAGSAGGTNTRAGCRAGSAAGP